MRLTQTASGDSMSIAELREFLAGVDENAEPNKGADGLQVYAEGKDGQLHAVSVNLSGVMRVDPGRWPNSRDFKVVEP